ncbi:hypothetical protein RM549_04625 [Salegentibacter sp. F188]|uniref:Uncharacterized protein n=1 Tax=Autumnicola patrickiae TaxID=3075591 RepID=A0ABU3DZC5_9FLAO|nr:hypothetical protein [Salegentibacter sp. F188]MDT0689057.1 hypothetical protein [Salegentibacter sp. F188]
MDGLDLLKKNWKKQEENLPHLSYDEIYKMIWKKSSSIVKWIFIISIIEFLLGTVLSIVLADKEYWQQMETLHLKEFMIFAEAISYPITLYFIYCFYKNYRKISSTDSASKLMKDILRTRKTVKYYIAYVLISIAIITMVSVYILIHFHVLEIDVDETSKYVFDTVDWIKMIAILTIALILLLGSIWLFYRLLYGILLRRLNRNYKELKNLDV